MDSPMVPFTNRLMLQPMLYREQQHQPRQQQQQQQGQQQPQLQQQQQQHHQQQQQQRPQLQQQQQVRPTQHQGYQHTSNQNNYQPHQHTFAYQDRYNMERDQTSRDMHHSDRAVEKARYEQQKQERANRATQTNARPVAAPRTNNLLSDEQHGFREGRSCLSNLLTTLDDWTSILDDGDCVDVAYLDFRKAFDLVSHKHLLLKLQKHGIICPVCLFADDSKIYCRNWATKWKMSFNTNKCKIMHLGYEYCVQVWSPHFTSERVNSRKITIPHVRLDRIFGAINAIATIQMYLALSGYIYALLSCLFSENIDHWYLRKLCYQLPFNNEPNTLDQYIVLDLKYDFPLKYYFSPSVFQEKKSLFKSDCNFVHKMVHRKSFLKRQYHSFDAGPPGKMLVSECVTFLTFPDLTRADTSASVATQHIVWPANISAPSWEIIIFEGSGGRKMKNIFFELKVFLKPLKVLTVVLGLKNIISNGFHCTIIYEATMPLFSQGTHSPVYSLDIGTSIDWERLWICEEIAHPVSGSTPDVWEWLWIYEEISRPVNSVSELQQDDEVVLGMQKEEMFTELQAIVGEEAYRQTMTSGGLLIIAYFLSWDPVSNALLRHLQGIVPTLSEAGSTALVRTVNCFDWPRICDNEGVLTYPVLKMFSKKNRNITYNGPIHGDYILKTVFLFEEVFPIEVKSDLEFEEILSLKLNTNAAHSSNSVAIGLYPNTEGTYKFKKSIKPLFGKYMVAYFVSVNKVQKICATNNGCILISKPKDIFQPHCVLNENLDDSDIIINFIQENSRHIFDVLEPERFSGLGPNGDSSKHVILFLPANVSLVPSDKHNFHAKMSYQETNINSSEQQNYKTPQVKNKGDEILQSEKDIYTTWNLIGNLAAENTNPDIIFSWIKSNDPVAMEVLPVYGLDENVASVALVDRGTAQVYTTYAQKRNLREWLDDALNSNIHPNLKLPEEAWEPRLPGFDYLKFMMEDQDREAEDHLILEMEREIIPKTGESSNMVKEEL
ncbi:unnamed protein product, partial [Meganyctiphanes norvegica]